MFVCICNVAKQHSQISNSTKMKSNNTNAVQPRYMLLFLEVPPPLSKAARCVSGICLSVGEKNIRDEIAPRSDITKLSIPN